MNDLARHLKSAWKRIPLVTKFEIMIDQMIPHDAQWNINRVWDKTFV